MSGGCLLCILVRKGGKMTVPDDRRENELITLFQLKRPPNATRGGTEKEAYILSDYKLAQFAPELLTIDILYEILGQKDVYTLEEARSLQKKQYTTKQYFDTMDLNQGYSPERMLSILKARCRYLIERGATLNNPHILASYFQGWEQITDNHAQHLRELVSEALQDNA
jgi:hypothetical protein